MRVRLMALGIALSSCACSKDKLAEPVDAAGTPGVDGATSITLSTVGGCAVFSPDDDWNQDISEASVDEGWTQKLRNLVGEKSIHPDYGNAGEEQYGIPINVVPANQPAVNIVFDQYPGESDPGPYPFPNPASIRIEGGDPTDCSGDCHVLVVQQGACRLYEGFACEHRTDGWHCANGAVWDLSRRSYGQRPKRWTSADAAGLPIMPGLLRYDEVQAGEVHHAIRFTLHCTQNHFVSPATHQAMPTSCQGDLDAPPMGLRVRLKADFDISAFPPAARAILTAMKRYGMILADNGADYYFQGEAHPEWNDEHVDALEDVPASAFEAIVPGPLEQ